jgi:hypothetical protein
MPPLPLASALGQRYFPHFGDVCAYVAQIAARYRPLAPLLVLVWLRLRRTLLRLDRLAIRCQQGRLRPPSTSTSTSTRTPPPPAHPSDAWRARRTPSGHAWLIRLHQPFAQYIPRIEMLVNDPDIVALCAAAPQAGRLLRPLCRMFAITPPVHIARPPRPAPPRKPRPQKPQPPPFAEHSPNVWPFVPLRLRLRVPNLRRPKPPD